MPVPSAAKKRTEIIDQILRAVKRGKTFFLSGHQKPDGDTVGSEIAFASFLRRLGKKADIYNYDPVPEQLMFLSGAGRIKSAHRVSKKYDVAVIFECSGADRMGNIIDFSSQARTVINIDHHAHHSFFGHINLVNPKASSNSEQLYYLFQRARMPLTKEEASALYVGLVTDTGRFQQENANPDSHEVARALHAAGAPVAEICRRLYATRSESALRLLGKALSRLRLEAGGQVSVMTLASGDFAETGASHDETEDIINHGLMPPSVEAAVFVRDTETPGRVKASLRGKGKVDLMKIAVSHGGGGHKNASGCTLSMPVERAVSVLLSDLRKALPPR